MNNRHNAVPRNRHHLPADIATHPMHATVGELMTARPFVVYVDTPLPEVAKLLGQHGIGGVPVVDATGAMVGVITETDLLRVRVTDDLWARWPGLRARHLMTSPVVTITAAERPETAARLLESHGVHRLIVVDERDGSTPVGVISSGDLVRGLAAGAGR
jgi:CBS domain-containing protein